MLGFLDETWWSRLARPELHAWTAGEPLRMHELAKAKDGPQALACYGLLRAETGGMMLRFVEGRPVSSVTEDFLGWLCERLAVEWKRVLVVVWDNAGWHVSERVRDRTEAHNRRVRREGGVRIRVCGLPVKAPWLNPIEPKWLHGKLAIAEPDRKLTAVEIQQRVHEHYHCEPEPPLKQNAS